MRGDLADDADFAEAAVAHVRSQYEPMAEKLLYGQVLPDGSRLALVASADQGTTDSAFLGTVMFSVHVPAGAPVSEGRVSYAGSINSDDGLAGWTGHGRDGALYLVLVNRPAPLDAEISSRIRYRPDGSASRTWRTVTGRDGSAVVELTSKVDQLVVARSRSGGPSVFPLLMTVDGELPPSMRERIAADLSINGVGGPYRGARSLPLRRAVLDGAWALVDPRDTEIRVLWSGELRGDQQGILLRLRRPDGAAFQLFVREEGTELFAQEIRHVPWGEADVLPWVVQNGQPGSPLLLISPSGVGTVVVAPRDGSETRRLAIEADGLADLGDQGAVGADLTGALLTVLAPSGRTVVQTVWSDQAASDPFVLEQGLP